MDSTGRKVSVKANQLIVSACTGPDLYRWLLARDSFLISKLVRRSMSALGQKQTCAAQQTMSALPTKADIPRSTTHVRKVPKAGSHVSHHLRSHRSDGARCKIGAISQYAQYKIIKSISQFGTLVADALEISAGQGEKRRRHFGGNGGGAY